MKREIKSVAMATLCCLMIFTSCAKTTRNVNNDEQVVSKELSTKDATGKDIPEWVKGSLGEGTLFEKVDIDGIGGADDEVYIITGRFDDYGSDYRNGLTVVYVHLGTGEVLAQAILCKGNYETRFANLIPGHEGNQIILEITDGNSTYLATNIFVIAVSVDKWQVGENDADVMRVPVISKLLDTTDYDRPVGGIEWREGISSGSISYGLEIVDIEGLEQQGLLEMSRNVQSGNTQNLKSTVIQRSFPKWSVAERRKTAAASDQAAVCACAHSRYFAGGSPSGLRV